MADLQTVLSRLDSDPDDPHVLAGLAAITEAARAGLDVAGAAAVAHLRKRCRDRGRPDVALKLFDAELAGTTGPRVADLLIAKAELLDEDLLDPRAAEACYQAALSVRPDAAAATEALESIALARDNWQKFAAKYVDEAKASTDRELTTALYLSAAETYARYAPEAPEVEAHLRASLAADPRNAKAGAHLQRLLARAGRWAELAETLAARVDHAATSEERVPAILALAEVTRGPLAQPERALELYKKVVAIDPAQPSALRVLGDALAAGENWQALVTLYGAALRARGGDGDLGMLLQVGMILWKRLADLEAAEDYFRRIRKLDAAHPVALDFYRAYHGGRGEGGKLVAILRQAEKALPVGAADTDGRAKALAVEIAELSEHQLGTPDKAIDAWKQLLRTDPTSTEARAALRRLYRKAEKWNPLLDLIKDEIERLPEAEVAGKIAGLYEVVAIYADKLRLDPMVLNTYNAILRLDPGDLRAIDELAGKYRAMGRWQDLIGILAKKAELEALPVADRAAILRESAELWIERFGNYAQAIRPLERLLELDRNDADAVARLKDIYTRRRQWRQLITLLGHEAEALTGADRRAKQNEMARLAAERVGDTRLAIEIHCRTLAEAGPGIGRAGDGQDETYAALAGLYEREKRYLALAEILGRQRVRAATTAEAVALLEKQGALLADRIGAPALAAEAFAAILAIEPHHAKALRTLRELYAAAADWERLEALYLGLARAMSWSTRWSPWPIARTIASCGWRWCGARPGSRASARSPSAQPGCGSACWRSSRPTPPRPAPWCRSTRRPTSRPSCCRSTRSSSGTARPPPSGWRRSPRSARCASSAWARGPWPCRGRRGPSSWPPTSPPSSASCCGWPRARSTGAMWSRCSSATPTPTRARSRPAWRSCAPWPASTATSSTTTPRPAAPTSGSSPWRLAIATPRRRSRRCPRSCRIGPGSWRRTAGSSSAPPPRPGAACSPRSPRSRRSGWRISTRPRPPTARCWPRRRPTRRRWRPWPACTRRAATGTAWRRS
jgi:tetratricopeptide (TPR) repeat protein